MTRSSALSSHDIALGLSLTVLLLAVCLRLSGETRILFPLEGAAIDFVRDAFGHLKAIGADQGGHVLLRSANVARDAGVVDVSDDDAFIAAAKTRQWDREKAVRTLA